MSWEDEAISQSAPVDSSWEDSARAESVRASDAEIEAARPKRATEVAWNALKNMGAGVAKLPGEFVTGAAGLVGKMTDKLGWSKGAEAGATDAREAMGRGIDSMLGTEQPEYKPFQAAGSMLATAGIPVEKAVPAFQAAFEAAHLPPTLAGFAARGAVNTGTGAVMGEASGHPVLGAATGAAATGLAEGAKALGGQIIKSYLKGGHRGAAEGLDVPWFVNREMGGSHAGMVRRVDDQLSALRNAQDAVITQKGNLPTPVLQALQNVENKINSPEFAAANLGSVPAAKAQLAEYVDDLIPISNPQTGEAPLKLAWEMKKKAGADAATLYRGIRSGNANVRDMTKQGVSAMVATELTNLLENQAPELTALNPEFSKLIPVARALERRGRIAGQHNPIGLDELAGIETGVNFFLNGNTEGLLIPLAVKASKMPAFGQLLRDAANKSPRMVPLVPEAVGAVDLTGASSQ